jgi:hypothetical protein
LDENDVEKNVAMVTRVNAFVRRSDIPLVTPSSVDFGTVGDWESPEKHVKIINQGTIPLTVDSVVSGSGKCSFDVLGSNDGFTTMLVKLQQYSDPGPISIEQSIATSQGDVIVKVAGEIRRWLYLDSDVLTFREGETPQVTAEKLVRVNHNSLFDRSQLSVKASEGWAVNVLSAIAKSSSETDLKVVLSNRSGGVARGSIVFTISDQDDHTCSAQFVVRPK